jgi:Skp family chaperone for outer membrane proteins
VHFRISIASIALMGFFAAPTVFGQAPAASPQAAPTGLKNGPTSVALVDVGYILKNHPNMNANMEGIKAEMTQAQEDIESRRTALLKDQEAIGKMFEADTPQFKQKQESLISQESKLRVDFMGKEKEFAEKQANVILKSYQSVNRAITAVATHYQYDVVLRYSRDQNEMDAKKPQSVNFGIQRDVLFFNPAIDATEMVLAVLNRDEPKAASPAPVSSTAAPAARSANAPMNGPVRKQ